MKKLLQALIKKASRAYQAKRLAETLEARHKNIIKTANDFYYSL